VYIVVAGCHSMLVAVVEVEGNGYRWSGGGMVVGRSRLCIVLVVQKASCDW
jgi:hypothetical protein